MKKYQDCKYPAFISYAHKDDQATGGWITQFHRAFIELLAGKIPRGIKTPNPAHMSGWNGPNHGQLIEQLSLNLADSHSLFIIVHDHYVTSEVCLQELKLFKKMFGDEGFRKRLFIIALTGNSIDTLEKKTEWQELVPKEQIWQGFFEVIDRNKPIPVITNNGDSIAPRFFNLLSPVVDALVEQIKAEIKTAPNQNPTQTIGIKTHPTPILAIAPTPKDLDEVGESFVKNLEGIPNIMINRITRDDLNDEDCQTKFQQADCVIQLFNSAPPYWQL
jgi:hypothetical protein